MPDREVPGNGTDPLNKLLAIQPAELITAVIEVDNGKFGAITIRTTSTTVTVILAGPDLDNWIAHLMEHQRELNSPLMVPSKKRLITGHTPNGNGPVAT